MGKGKKIAIILLTFLISIIAYSFGLNQDQIVSVTILSIFILSSLLFWRLRLAFAFLGIVGMFLSGVLDIPHFIEFAGFDIILFLVGMMIIVGFLENRHFFEYLMENVVRTIGPRPELLIVALMIMAAVFASMVDEVTSILFMSSATIHLAERYKVNPIPFVIMVVFATNIGSSATVIGNPVGIMIALNADLTFLDFLRWATPISAITLLIAIPLSMLYFSSDIKKFKKAMLSDKKAIESPEIEAHDIKLCWAFTFGTLPILFFHSWIEKILYLEKNTMLLGAAFLSAGLALLIEGDNAKRLVARRVDWWTLTFFMFLFASVGTLKYVGVIDIIANGMFSISGNNVGSLLVVLSSTTALLTALLDNVLVVATFIPVVQGLASLDLFSYHLWWGMLFASTLFGNLTMIGSTANIIALGVLESRKIGPVTLRDWIVPGIIVSVPTLTVAIILVYLQIPLMPGS